MATGGARRGRRDNGLVAAEYAAAGDVDPRIGEHLLDVLGLRGIAAYLQPAADLHPVTRSTTLPDRPTDRLFVDRAHVDTARSFLRQLTGAEAEAATDLAATDRAATDRAATDRAATDRPGTDRTATDRSAAGERPASPEPAGTREPTTRDPAASRDRPERGDPELGDDGARRPPSGDPSSADIDELFAAIVAAYDTEAAGTAWPDAENLPPERASGLGRALTADPEPGTDPTGTQHSGDPGAGDQSRTLRRWQDSTIRPDGWRSPTDDRGLLEGLDGLEPEFDGDDEEGYTPPPPPPLPKIAPATIVAVLAIIAGVVIFFNPTLLPVDETVAMVFGFCGILGGFVALIWRLRPGDDDDDHWDPNDGAVV